MEDVGLFELLHQCCPVNELGRTADDASYIDSIQDGAS